MIEPRWFRHVSMALVISVVLNCVLVLYEFSTAGSNIQVARPSVISRIVDVLGMPVGATTELLALAAPWLPGHDFSAVILIILISIAFYASVAWGVLTLLFWRRDHNRRA
jgi:hypothetical protein